MTYRLKSKSPFIKGSNIKTTQPLTKRLQNIQNLLDFKKGEHIRFFDLSQSDYFADGVVLCNSLSAKHALALLDDLKTLKPQEDFLNTDTKSEQWIIADMGDIIVHIVSTHARSWFELDRFFDALLDATQKTAIQA